MKKNLILALGTILTVGSLATGVYAKDFNPNKLTKIVESPNIESVPAETISISYFDEGMNLDLLIEKEVITQAEKTAIEKFMEEDNKKLKAENDALEEKLKDMSDDEIDAYFSDEANHMEFKDILTKLVEANIINQEKCDSIKKVQEEERIELMTKEIKEITAEYVKDNIISEDTKNQMDKYLIEKYSEPSLQEFTTISTSSAAEMVPALLMEDFDEEIALNDDSVEAGIVISKAASNSSDNQITIEFNDDETSYIMVDTIFMGRYLTSFDLDKLVEDKIITEDEKLKIEEKNAKNNEILVDGNTIAFRVNEVK